MGILFGNNGSPEALWQMPMSGPIWFLLALFWCRLFFGYIYNNSSKPFYWMTICISLSFFSSLFGYYVVNPPFGIIIGMTSLVFFAIGKLLTTKKITWQMVVIFVIFWFIAIKYSRLEMALFIYKMYPLDVIGSLGGIAVMYGVSLFICTHIPSLNAVWSFIGENTLLILCYHQLAYLFIEKSNGNLFAMNLKEVVFVNLMIPLLCLFLHNYTKKCIVILRNNGVHPVH